MPQRARSATRTLPFSSATSRAIASWSKPAPTGVAITATSPRSTTRSKNVLYRVFGAAPAPSPPAKCTTAFGVFVPAGRSTSHPATRSQVGRAAINTRGRHDCCVLVHLDTSTCEEFKPSCTDATNEGDDIVRFVDNGMFFVAMLELLARAPPAPELALNVYCGSPVQIRLPPILAIAHLRLTDAYKTESHTVHVVGKTISRHQVVFLH
jgi:hypothetical protein